MFSPPFLRCFVFSAGEDKTVALECKNALAAAHSDIAHETAFFLHRTGQPTRIALLYLRIRYGSASTTKIIKTIVIFSSLIKPVVM